MGHPPIIRAIQIPTSYPELGSLAKAHSSLVSLSLWGGFAFPLVPSSRWLSFWIPWGLESSLEAPPQGAEGRVSRPNFRRVAHIWHTPLKIRAFSDATLFVRPIHQQLPRILSTLLIGDLFAGSPCLRQVATCHAPARQPRSAVIGHRVPHAFLFRTDNGTLPQLPC